MKIYSPLVIFFFFSLKALSNSIISIDEFKKLSFTEQDKIISEANDADKAKWTKIYRQSFLEKKWGGKEGYLIHQGDLIIITKGLVHLMMLVSTQQQLWHAYANEEILKSEKRGVRGKALGKIKAALNSREQNLVIVNEKWIRPILINTAPSSSATLLDKKAELLVKQLHERFLYNNPEEIKLNELENLDKSITEIAKEFESLPTLSPEQVKAEYEALPQDELMK